MKKFLLALIFLMSFSGTGCAAEKPVDLEAAKDLSVSVEKFCWKYFALKNRDENYFFSPYGIHSMLSILSNGASGETLKDILNALEVDNVETLNDGHKNFSALIEKNYRGENFFAEASLLLIDKKISGRGLDKNFKNIVSGVYNSEVREADFKGNLDGEKKKIRSWVADKTKNFIPQYSSIMNEDTTVDFLNVVYFKGKWAAPFKADETTAKDFKNVNGSIGKTYMMSKVFNETIKYRADEKFKAIELPYSANAAMYLILPADEDALNVVELWNAQSSDYRADFLNALKNSYPFDGEVVVRMPKMTFEYDDIIVENFKQLGLQRAFSDDAEFFNIVKDTSLKINNARHDAIISIDEEGTKAAAVTEVTMIETTAAPNPRPPKRVYFIADRPHILVIRDVESGMTLFAGCINRMG